MGGAARAAIRLHRGLLDAGEDSCMLTRHRTGNNPGVLTPPGLLSSTGALLRGDIGNLALKAQVSGDNDIRSAAWLPSGMARKINQTPHQLVNLHWLGGETLSIADIGNIKGPVVWTLHDMWAFCGCEHYAHEGSDARWRNGYTRENRTSGSHGLDLDRWTWERKRRHWRRPFTLITPSRWLADCARQSKLLHDWPIHTVPNPIDTSLYLPTERAAARDALGLPRDRRLILFGAAGGSRDPRKGFDLLLDALLQLHENVRGADYECLVLGENEPAHAPETGYATRWLGHIKDDHQLALVYSAADVLVLPSRQDNLPQSGTEAQACGCPVVAFDTGGLADVVEHERTGYLAPAFDTTAMANYIAMLLQNSERNRAMSHTARERAVQLWSYKSVIPAYLDVYSQAMESV
jgi:glycosyltransferase involved in cell wall biosynthesis